MQQPLQRHQGVLRCVAVAADPITCLAAGRKCEMLVAAARHPDAMRQCDWVGRSVPTYANLAGMQAAKHCILTVWDMSFVGSCHIIGSSILNTAVPTCASHGALSLRSTAVCRIMLAHPLTLWLCVHQVELRDSSNTTIIRRQLPPNSNWITMPVTANNPSVPISSEQAL
jgi:hypothetical protein